jgi:hypothetical protein
MKKRQDLKDRRERIYSLRKEGKTLAQLAEQYGLSKERVRGLCLRAKFEQETLPTLPPLMQKLSARSRNGLSLYFRGDDVFSHPERIVELGRKGLLRFKNLGEQAVDEISAALEALGYIKDIVKWYGPAYKGKQRGITHMADTWITDIRHFLNEKGEFPKELPGPARSLAMYFGKIIEAVSNRGKDENEAQTDIPCRKKPGNRKCGVPITARIREDSSIQWRCPACGDNGIISGWHDTAWDKRLAIRKPKEGRPKDSKAAKKYQLTITLAGSHPAIWRRVVVDAGIALSKLHYVIQDVMGWTNSHLHQFRHKKVYYHEPWEDDGWEDDFLDENEYALNQLLTRPKAKMIYEYDFGDSWDHEVVLEKILEKDPKMKTPVCLEGAMACPPEDCGGIGGYYDYLAAVKNPKHPQYEEIREWMGRNFDPEKFELEKINKALKSF